MSGGAKSDFELDPILEEIGNFGKYQLFNYVLLVVPVIFNAFFTISYIFTAANDPHRCLIEECENKNTTTYETSWLTNAIPYQNDKLDQCNRFISRNDSFAQKGDESSCPGYRFDPDAVQKCNDWVYRDGLTIVSEFNLGCQDWKRTLVGTLNSIGQFVCLPISGFISDKFGRRSVLIGGAVISGVFGTIRSLAPNYWTFGAMEFMDTALGSGIYSAAFILGIELVGPKQRVVSGAIISSFYAIGEILLGCIAWLVPYWRHLLRILYIPALSLVSYFWIVPESVRWHLSKGKIQEAKDTLKRAAKINGRTLSEKSIQSLDNEYDHVYVISHNIEKNINLEEHELKVRERSESSFVKILRSRTMVIRIVVCSFWWMTCTFVYYGMSLNSVAVSGNTYLNFILVALIEVPAYLTTAYVTDRFGRKHSLSVSFLGSGVACLAFIFLPKEIFWLRMTLYLTGKFCITIAFTSLYVYTSELYPTSMRHSLLGTCSMFGRIGSIVAPQTPLLQAYMESLPLILFGGTALASGILVFPFPETLNTKLPDTLEEAENISNQKILSR